MNCASDTHIPRKRSCLFNRDKCVERWQRKWRTHCLACSFIRREMGLASVCHELIRKNLNVLYKRKGLRLTRITSVASFVVAICSHCVEGKPDDGS
jgi:hypothetical protein